MMATDGRIEERSKAQAREWHLVMHSGEVDETTRDRFEAWLHADRSHKRAYRAYEQLYRDLDYAMPRAGVDLNTLLARRPAPLLARLHGLAKPPVWAASLAGGAVAVLLFVALIFPGLTPAPSSSAYTTEIAEISEITLEDGSLVTLGAKSRIEATFAPDARRINLAAGEAFFEVAEDPARPFYVVVDHTLVRVVGTKFDVKNTTGKVHVAVLEGVVEVTRPETMPKTVKIGDMRDAPKQVLTAGERITVKRRAEPGLVEPIEQVRPGAWRSGRLSYEDASLAEIVADLNRYHRRQIRVASPDLGNLRATMTFNATDIEQVLDMVEAIHPVEVDRRAPDEVVLRHKHDRS
ncbi:MAG: FecR domain-containing protein [Sphingomonadales bacterium]|nr:FecR domain-containing protein [Sphingomonadales bacterium]